MEVKAVAKRWGSSIGVIIPKEVVDAKRIKENDKITIEIKSGQPSKNMFGRFPRRLKKTAQELKDDVRKGWLSNFDRKREAEWNRKK